MGAASGWGALWFIADANQAKVCELRADASKQSALSALVGYVGIYVLPSFLCVCSKHVFFMFGWLFLERGYISLGTSSCNLLRICLPALLCECPNALTEIGSAK